MSPESEWQRIRRLMTELGVSPNKNLGQNFLINEKVIYKIINYKDLTDSCVVEIGPGLGALTTRLQEKTKNTLLVEFDKKLSEYWLELGFDVENTDALKKDWSQLDSKFKTLISNLPYDISAPLVINLSTTVNPLETMVLMFQKEVAQRITAKPDNKSYGLISVIAQNTWKVKKLADLRPGDFYPPPKIQSRVLSFERKATSSIDKGFLGFVKHCFLNRRKMVLKNMKSYGKSKGLEESFIIEAMHSIGINSKARPENISPEAFLKLYHSLNQNEASLG